MNTLFVPLAGNVPGNVQALLAYTQNRNKNTKYMELQYHIGVYMVMSYSASVLRDLILDGMNNLHAQFVLQSTCVCTICELFYCFN